MRWSGPVGETGAAVGQHDAMEISLFVEMGADRSSVISVG
jgi:hypothetical protein